MKWGPFLAMAALFFLGVWLVWGSNADRGLAPLRNGAHTLPAQIGNERCRLEVLSQPDGAKSFRFLYRDGSASDVVGASEFINTFGQQRFEDVTANSQNPLFKLLNITSWGSLLWIAIGLAGQCAFFGRMLVQWLISERQGESIIPISFWWLSFFGGLTLFAYFVWRQDIIGVMGQSTGIVIYARNLRLIGKQKRRALAATTKLAD
ncbi:MAG: lipid-A-disaccharide synthase N-terminal domain-containing protein [Planctomycetota bacterium]|nr:lipid-A-disaccharide synthase N-terminal domain-containing protein [Planctomycetota bacterium]